MRQRRLVLTLSVLTAVFAAGYGVMFTVLDDFRDRYHIPDSQLGLIVAVGFFASFAAQVFFAPLADRGHARSMMYAGMALNIVGLIGMAAGHVISVLVLGRVVMGLGAGIAVPALRRIVILADPDHLGHNIGRLLSADVAGFAMGPAVSAVLVGPFGIAAPFIVIAVATAVFFPVMQRMHVDESNTIGDAGSEVSERSARFAFDLLRVRVYVGALCLGCAGFLMVGTFDALWVLVLNDLHTSTWIANLGITLFALPMIILGPLGGRLCQRVGPFRVGTIGLLIASCYMVAYGHLPTGGAMFAVSMLHALSDGLTISASGVAVALVTPHERQAGGQGLLGGAQTLMGGVAALVAGELYQRFGRATAYTTCAVAMVALVGIGLWCVGRTWAARPPADDPEAVATVGA